MTIFRDIMTAVRGGVREAGEAIVDANSTRIFSQQIKDADEHLRNAKRDLTGVIAKQMQSSRKLEVLKSDVKEHEDYAAQALDKGDEELALEVAEKITGLDDELKDQAGVVENLAQHVERLKILIRNSERQIREYQRQLTMVRTTESVQKATAAISLNFAVSNTGILNARESLERIKRKQREFDDRLTAADLIEKQHPLPQLEEKLVTAGIIKVEKANEAQAVLDRISARKNKNHRNSKK